MHFPDASQGVLDEHTIDVLRSFLASNGFAESAGGQQGIFGHALGIALQKFLRACGDYKGPLDANFRCSSSATESLERFLSLHWGFRLTSPAHTVSNPNFVLTSQDQQKLQGLFGLLEKQWNAAACLIDSNPVRELPVWVPDNEASACKICAKEFGRLWPRRHHCRLCGGIVCSDCSARRIDYPSLNFKNVRACTVCALVTQHMQES